MAMLHPPALIGHRILVVEDMLLVAELIANQLQDWGITVVGPASRLHQALDLVATEELDGALLDVNLAGVFCFPIADALSARHVPFLFVTGYGEGVIPAEYRAVPRLQKPFDMAAMARMMSRHLCGVRGIDPRHPALPRAQP